MHSSLRDQRDFDKRAENNGSVIVSEALFCFTASIGAVQGEALFQKWWDEMVR